VSAERQQYQMLQGASALRQASAPHAAWRPLAARGSVLSQTNLPVLASTGSARSNKSRSRWASRLRVSLAAAAVDFAAAMACLAAILAVPEAAAVTEKQPTGAAYGASCITPWGVKIDHGKTAQGFCVHHARSGAACGFTKLCNNGQWVPK